MNVFPKLGFEQREGQENMALDICDAIVSNKHILIEAGVGIGKSFAYLVPLMYYNKFLGCPVAISTSTILLQEQLEKDIQTLSKILKIYPEVILAKGMSNFICDNRAFNYINHNKKNIKSFLWLEKWMKDPDNRDRAKLPIQLSDAIWNNINVNNCKYDKCEYYFKCYYVKKRNRMLYTNGIILCNHDLLTVDAQKKNKGQRPILASNIKFIVIDEAHNLENKVRNSLKEEWSFEKCCKSVKEANKFIKRTYSYRGMDDENYNLFKLLREIYTEFWKQAQIQCKKLDVDEIERFYINPEKVCKKISLFIKEIDNLNTKVQLCDNRFNNRIQDNIIENLENAIEFFKNLIFEKSNMLFWIELKNERKSFKSINIAGCPKRLDKEIRQLFFREDKPKTILTSATLTNKFNGSDKELYSYIIKTLGYPMNSGELSSPQKSPYNYDKNCLIYYKENMPHPTNDRELFIKECINEIIKLLNLTNGKTMILFTAKRDMIEVYNALINKKLPWKILMQQEGSSQDSVISQFKSDINSVLLGTGVYWEGISVEGIALSNLIITRLPFPVPDPVINYKRGLANNSLMEVDVPEMLIKLRQGVGRLIRNYKDKGIITILDPRVGNNFKSPYKDMIWDALPMKIKTNDINIVKNFIKDNINL